MQARPLRIAQNPARRADTLRLTIKLSIRDMTPSRPRADALRRFAEPALAATGLPIEPASADASFRSYWRVDGAPTRSYIVMDAPPDKENIEPWLDIGARLRAAGLHAPEVLAVDREHGFVLMEDLGTRIYLARARRRDRRCALRAMRSTRCCACRRRSTRRACPHFDEAFMTMELELMPEWFLRRHLGHRGRMRRMGRDRACVPRADQRAARAAAGVHASRLPQPQPARRAKRCDAPSHA